MRMLRKAGEAYGLLGQSLLKNVRVRDNILDKHKTFGKRCVMLNAGGC